MSYLRKRYQLGGKATTADSLALYNNTMAIKNYYLNNPNYRQIGSTNVYSKDPSLTTYQHNVNDKVAEAFIKFRGAATTGYDQSGLMKITDVAPDQYRKDIDKNRYYQRESANVLLDMKAPMSLFDRRISPAYNNAYENIGPKTPENIGGDFVSIYAYDPLQVKPWNMLTDKERALRIKRYGMPNGSGNAARPKAKMEFPNVNSPQAEIANLSSAKGSSKQEDLPYSFTYPSLNERGDYTSQDQQTIRFKTKKELYAWADKNAVNVSGSTDKTLTGYKKQKGGNTPIYTSNKNDPRLRAYQDSIDAKSYTDYQMDYWRRDGNGKGLESFDPNSTFKGDTEPLKQVFAYRSLQPIQILRGQKKDSGQHTIIPVFQNPVQPVYYKPISKVTNKAETKRADSEFRNTFLDIHPEAQMNELNSVKQHSMQESLPYTFTYPTFQGGNSQKTIGFKTKDELYKWADKNARGWDGASDKTLTGYLKKDGGMNPNLELALKNFPVNYKKGGKKRSYSSYYQHGGIEGGNPSHEMGPVETQNTLNTNPFAPNWAGLGMVGAYLGSQALLNKQSDRHYEAYRNRWIRDYSIPSLIQDPNKFGDEMYETPIYEKGGNWIQGAVNPAHEGYCTPMSKSTCTPRRKALARRFKAMAKKQDGGLTMETPQQQASGYFGYPNASSLHFPGKGKRTFVPGPFPLMVKDQHGVQPLIDAPISTFGAVTEMPMFKDGGEVSKYAPKVKRKDATIEAEKDELIFGAGAPGGIEDQKDRIGAGLFKIKGKKHYNGGTPLKAFPGDFVFSNDKGLAFNEEDAKDLVGDTIKKDKQRTPAKLAQKYLDLNKFISMAQDKDLDPITKKTAILNVNNFIDRLGEIAYAQEEQKGFPTGIPAFAQASLQARGYDSEALQAQLSGGMMKFGGEVSKYQTGGGYPNQFKSYYDTKKKIGYKPPQGLSPTDFYATPGLVDYMSTLDQLPGVDNDLHKADDSVWGYRHQMAMDKFYPDWGQRPPYMQQDANVTPPQLKMQELSGPKDPSLNYQESFNNYISKPNDKFNLTAAEAYGLYASNRQFKSRYPTAYRNYEIQNAKSLVNSSYRPISEQPYLNSIRRSTLGFEQNNNPNGAAGYSRSLGAFNAGLQAENQAVSQVYAQNISRRDNQAQALANLEIQDGIDRITNFEKYDTKLETLAQNKENEAKYRMTNNANQLNQMQRDRESLSLFNTQSDYYQINPNRTLGIKPTYKIENGKLVPQQRNMADLIKSQNTTTNSQYMNTLEQVFKLMQQYGISNSAFVDNVMKSAVVPPR